MVKELGGRLAVQPGILSIPILREAGVSRISVGPMLLRKQLDLFKTEAVKVLEA